MLTAAKRSALEVPVKNIREFTTYNNNNTHGKRISHKRTCIYATVGQCVLSHHPMNRTIIVVVIAMNKFYGVVLIKLRLAAVSLVDRINEKIFKKKIVQHIGCR